MKKFLTIIPVITLAYLISWSVYSQNQNSSDYKSSGIIRDLNIERISEGNKNLNVPAKSNFSIVDSGIIQEIYTLGQVPDPNGLPDTICVYYQKTYHGFPRINLKFTFKNYFTNEIYSEETITISDTSIHSGTYCLKVPDIPASLLDNNNSKIENNFSRGPSVPNTKIPLLDIVQAVAGDTAGIGPKYFDDTINNSMDYCNFITFGSYNHANPCEPDDGGVGFTGVSGNILAGFRNKAASSFIINSIDHNFYDTIGGGNSAYRLIIYGDNGSGMPGALLYLSPLLASPPGANSSVKVTYNIPSPVSIPANSKFYIGIRQTSTTNIGMSYQNEDPVRSESFFYSTTDTSNWTDFSSTGFNYRLNISPISNNDVKVVPNAYESINGTGTFLGPLATAQRTYQLLIQASQLTGLAGKGLTGLSFRIPASATANWPLSDVTFTNYDIYLSGSVEPSARSLTFANNIVGPQTQVRSGPLTILANSYSFGGSPNTFGTEISFSTPWLYSGGNVLVEIRHTGFTGTSRSTDAIITSTPGYGTLVSACWTGNYTGTAGAQGNFSIIKLTAAGTQPELNLTALIEGFYNGSSMISDTATVLLANSTPPYPVVDSAKSVLNSSGEGNFNFSNALNGTNYYIVMKHRNSLETWSKSGGEAFSGGTLNYDFTTSASQAFGSNLVLKGDDYCIYSGDVNQDGIIDVTDNQLIDNDAYNFVSGYVSTDVNGDNAVDLADAAIADNNAYNFVTVVSP